MKISVLIGWILALEILFSTGCTEKQKPMAWRRDVAPIHRRMPALTPCINMLWHGEVLGQNSFWSIPGPSECRIGCFIPEASRILPSLTSVVPAAGTAQDIVETEMEKEEIKMLKSEFGIDDPSIAIPLGKDFVDKIIKPEHWGKCLYFQEKDILFIIWGNL